MKEEFCADAFGVYRMTAITTVKRLLGESWTDARKDEIIQQMSKEADFIDRVVVGDYDLVLWKFHGGYYAVSINSGQEDPTSIEGQKRHPSPQKFPFEEVVLQLRQWVRQYGKLLIGSSKIVRIQQYRRMLLRYFLIGEWGEHPSAGFFILPD